MDITKVPFNKLLGISLSKDSNFLLQLDAREEYTNHLGTIHAAALFALAEGSGAQFLLNAFPNEIVQNSIPVLRKVEVNYKKPANGIIVSSAIIKNDTIENITHHLTKKKRALVTTIVDLYDSQQVKVFTGNFEWFIIMK
jgi:acyl-coenzyme A thioesterase PaaI-like protein